MYKDLADVQINVHFFNNRFQDTKFNYNIAQFEKKTKNINVNKKSKFQLMFFKIQYLKPPHTYSFRKLCYPH